MADVYQAGDIVRLADGRSAEILELDGELIQFRMLVDRSEEKGTSAVIARVIVKAKTPTTEPLPPAGSTSTQPEKGEVSGPGLAQELAGFVVPALPQQVGEGETTPEAIAKRLGVEVA